MLILFSCLAFYRNEIQECIADLWPQVSPGTGTSQWLDAGIGLAVGTLLLMVGLIVYIMSRHRHEPPEERQMKKATAKLRNELCITAADGFLLTSERRSLSAVFAAWQRSQPVYLQRSFVEAAARLSMFQDFDLHQFDAFCICLRCGTRDDESPENSATPAYSAMCDWLLDISKTLIKPDVSSHGDSAGKVSFVESKCNLAYEERFSYFQRRVCRARVWSDMGGILFQRLKKIAQVCLRVGLKRTKWP